MLVVKIDLEQNKENYQAVIDALVEFDILSASWEDKEQKVAEVDPKLRVAASDGDLGAALSSAVDRIRQRQNGQ